MSEQSQALTVIERAQVALQPAANDKQLAELAVQSKSITTITNAAGYQQCHSARMALKNQRVAIEKIAKSAREDATAFSKAVIAEEKRLIGIIEPEEKRLETLQSEWDAARAAEKAAREEAERQRIAEIQRRLVKLEALGSGELYTSAMDPERLQDILRQLEEPSAYDYAEFAEQAATLRQRAIVAIRQAHIEALERIERENAERAAREAEEARIAAERAEQERQDAERRAAEEARLRAEREAEEQRLAEVRRRLDAEQAEQRRIAEIKQWITALNGPTHLTATDSPILIHQAIETLKDAPIDDRYAELQEEAKLARARGITRLVELLNAADAHKAEQERIATERAELERRQREQEAAVQAERDRIAAEERRLAQERAEIERRERERRETEERQRREAAEAEERRIAAEQAEAVRIREVEERAQALARAKEEARQLLASLTAKAIAEWIAHDIGCEIHEVAARIAEIPVSEWATLAAGTEVEQEEAA